MTPTRACFARILLSNASVTGCEYDGSSARGTIGAHTNTKMNETIDVAIVGAGVVGLAAACAIAARDHTTCVVEREARAGLGGSTHNSGVIHAGIYYPPGSTKAALCVEGRERLYAFCRAHDIPHERCGKLVVTSDDADIGRLETLAANAQANGVDDLEVVARGFIRDREPHIAASHAIWSPSTGIVEAEALVRTLVKHAAARNVALLASTALEHGVDGRHAIEFATGRETIRARTVINAAGLYADEVSAALGGDAFTIYPVRGDYAELVPSARHLVRGLVYPLPEPSGHGLGVHLTRTTWGTVALGPTARYQNRKDDYESDRVSLRTFHELARRFLPELSLHQLRAGGSGIRARGAPAGQPFADFRIARDTRIPRLVHAAGIDSPGLTASLAIAERLADLVDETLS